MKNFLLRSIAAILIACTLSLVAVSAEQHALASKLVRLHVIANSSSEEDQALKLRVRDAVLEAASGLTEDSLPASLPHLRLAAERAVLEAGEAYPVTVKLGPEEYGTREYDTFSLPAGEYLSLRVEIGAAEGRNWWCVLFPPLCFASSEEFEEEAASAGLTDADLELVRGSGQDIQIRFRILELIQKLAHLFHD